MTLPTVSPEIYIVARQVRHTGGTQCAPGTPEVSPEETRPSPNLLVSQCDHRIHLGGSASWNITGQQSDGDQHNRSRYEAHGVGGTCGIEQRPHDARSQESSNASQQQTEYQQLETLPEYH